MLLGAIALDISKLIGETKEKSHLPKSIERIYENAFESLYLVTIGDVEENEVEQIKK